MNFCTLPPNAKQWRGERRRTCPPNIGRGKGAGMSGELEVECGYQDSYGCRPVTARCGRNEYRDRFDTSDPFNRQAFAQAALGKLRLDISVDAVARLDRLVVRESAACDSRAFVDRQQPRVRRFSDLAPSQVEWLWPGRIPLGAVTILAGDPGLG